MASRPAPSCRLRLEPLNARDCPAAGLSAVYFDSPDLARAKSLTGPAVAATVATVDFDWGAGGPAAGVGTDTFAARFAGELQAVEAGTYAFRVRADDGVRLWVDNKLVIDRWGDFRRFDALGRATLEAGRRYAITLECYEAGGTAALSLQWLRPGRQDFDVIPRSALSSVPHRLPADGNVVNVKDFGAVGDGVADDRAAIMAAIAAAVNDGPNKSRYAKPQFVYLPAGTYRVSDTVEGKGDPGWSNGWRSGVILAGAGRDVTTLRLDDGNPLFADPASPRAVVKTGSENDGNSSPGGGGNRAFRNSVLHLTVDTGRNNPGAVGIDYLTSNRGAVEHVRIRSADRGGVAGLAMDRNWPGPGLVKHLAVEGFGYGVTMRSHYQYGMTFEDVRLTGQRAAGVYTDNNALNIRRLRSDNAVPAVRAAGGNNQVVLLDSQLVGGAGDQPAVFTAGYLTARNVVTAGYGLAVDSQGGLRADVPGGPVGEYLSHAGLLRPGSAAGTLNLPVEEAPEFYTADPADWANVEAFGATRNNAADDDAPAIQAAIDSGKPVVYLPSGTYHLGGPVVVRGGVRKVVGLQAAVAARAGAVGAEVRFEGAAGAATTLEHLNLGVPVVHAGAGCLAVRHADFGTAGVHSTPTATGKLFLEDTIGRNIRINGPLTVWGRQVNSEFGTDPLIVNTGGTMWLFGFKTEGETTAVRTVNGTTELLGGFFYPLSTTAVRPPLLESVDSRVAYTFMTNGSLSFPVLVRSTRGGVTWDLPQAGSPRRVVLFTDH